VYNPTRLREFISVYSPSAAGRIANKLVGKIQLLPDFPKMGAPTETAPVRAIASS